MRLTRFDGFRIFKADLSKTLNIASSGSETFTFDETTTDLEKYEAYQILALRLYFPIPSGASSGSHRLEGYYKGTNVRLIEGQSTYTSVLNFKFNHWENANSYGVPGQSSNGLNQFFKCIYTSDLSLEVKYYNNTDVSATGNAIIEAIIKAFPFFDYQNTLPGIYEDIAESGGEYL